MNGHDHSPSSRYGAAVAPASPPAIVEAPIEADGRVGIVDGPGQRDRAGHRGVDDYLGDSKTRYFSSGYRRVSYTFPNGAVSTVDEPRVRVDTTVRLHYPADWSKKSSAKGPLRPHLSSVDAILLSGQLAELCVVQAFVLDEQQRSEMWLAALSIRAGAAPDEELDRIPASAELVSAARHDRTQTQSTVHIRLGRMRLRCVVVHPRARPNTLRWREDAVEVMLGSPTDRYYGDAFRHGGHAIRELVVDRQTLRAAALVSLGAVSAPRGLEGAYRPNATAVDAFVVGLQLGQVLLYELDGLSRGSSHTLWMRNATIEAPPPRALRLSEGLSVTAQLDGVRLIEKEGGAWRAAAIVAELAGIRLRCNVTHQLPAAA